MRVLTLLLTYWEDKSKTEMRLCFKWKNYFLKTMVYVEKYFEKKNCNVNVVFYFKQIAES